MLRPWARTNPTEFVFALAARHMITSAILFNRRTAFGAFLGISADPVGRLTVIRTFFQPQAHNSTNDRLVSVQTTAKAEWMAAVASNSRYDGI